MYTKELSDVTDNMTRQNGNPKKKTKNSSVQSSQSLNWGWNLTDEGIEFAMDVKEQVSESDVIV
jgi:hypothetical protein